MGIIKGFTFDGVNSLDHNIGITGSAVYNAPTRDVEMISIPGRDGEYSLDHGRFNNIEITYPAGMYDTSQTDFATRISELRNQLASRVGYKRLEDEYNPDEYRMAIYKSGLEVSPVQYSRAGQFDIIFDCKPQRWLKSGESAISVANNGTVSNPTLFASKPLITLNASGPGTVKIGGSEISLLDAPLGVIELGYGMINSTASGYVISRGAVLQKAYETGDPITVTGASATFKLYATQNISSISYASGQDLGYNPAESSISGKNCTVTLYQVDPITITAGTSMSTTLTGVLNLVIGGTSSSQTITLNVSYSGGSSKTINFKWKVTPTNASVLTATDKDTYKFVADSTTYALTGNLYIDLDIGEAYRIQDNVTTSINNFVNLGGELPTLPPGNSTITYSNTVSNFKVTPRWYKL